MSHICRRLESLVVTGHGIIYSAYNRRKTFMCPFFAAALKAPLLQERRSFADKPNSNNRSNTLTCPLRAASLKAALSFSRASSRVNVFEQPS